MGEAITWTVEAIESHCSFGMKGSNAFFFIFASSKEKRDLALLSAAIPH